jgi:flagellar biosynthesis GTPase FlhF
LSKEAQGTPSTTTNTSSIAPNQAPAITPSSTNAVVERRTTRARNANVHPGLVDLSPPRATRRTSAEVQAQKEKTAQELASKKRELEARQQKLSEMLRTLEQEQSNPPAVVSTIAEHIDSLAHSDSQPVEDKGSQPLENEASQPLENEASQHLQDEGSQYSEDEGPLYLEGDGAQPLETIEACSLLIYIVYNINLGLFRRRITMKMVSMHLQFGRYN